MQTVKTFSNDPVVAGYPVAEGDLVLVVLKGLGPEYKGLHDFNVHSG